MDKIDRLILDYIQSSFPVDAHPYDVVAADLNSGHGLELSGQEVWERVIALRKHGYIRRLGAVFDSSRLGYRSTLCVAKVPKLQISSFAELVNAYPQVTHNYVRSDDYNIWFTFSSDPSDCSKNFIDELKKASGIDEIFEVESLKVFKVNAVFTLQQD